MRNLVRAGKKSLDIRLLAGDLTQSLGNKAWFDEIRTLFDYVQSNIRYTLDINGVETLQTPEVTLSLGYGDCDDMCVLLASMLESIGHPTRFRAIGFTPNEYEHVFVETQIGGSGQWMALDPTEPNPAGWSPPGVISYMVCNN